MLRHFLKLSIFSTAKSNVSTFLILNKYLSVKKKYFIKINDI